MEKVIPDYKGKSIVNLTATISNKFKRKTPYQECAYLKSKDLEDCNNVILLVIDGLGYEYIKRFPESVIFQNTCSKITSVFPSTTAAAMTTFNTGVAPLQHGFTGWFVLLKELGAVTTVLPFQARGGGSFREHVEVKEVLCAEPFMNGIKSATYIINPQELSDSAYSTHIAGKSHKLSYSNLNGMFKQITTALNGKERKKYIFSYWSQFDTLVHNHGFHSKEAEEHFWELDSAFNNFIQNMKKKKTAIILTADHGLIDTTEQKRIRLDQHPKLDECLSQPLCGDPRVAMCYVKPRKVQQFKEYVKNNLSHACELIESERLLSKGLYGLGQSSEPIYDRIGDYILLMKDNYVFVDFLLNEKRAVHKGNHGGLSKEEVYVPLVVVKNV